MVILLNGSFGIGKTTTARALQLALPDAMLSERIGWVLQRLPRWIPLGGRGTGDFQDMPIWRSVTIRGIRLARWRRSTVIVPMAFSNLKYLNEIREGIRAFEPDVRHLCLVAPLEIVKERLAGRGLGPGGPAWAHRRATECCEAHARPEFGEPVLTAGRGVSEVVEDVLRRIGSAGRD